MKHQTMRRSVKLSRWKQSVVMSSSVASWQKGRLWERQKVFVQAVQAAGARFTSLSLLLFSRVSNCEGGLVERSVEKMMGERRRRFAEGSEDRGIMVLFLKQVHLQKVWGATREAGFVSLGAAGEL